MINNANDEKEYYKKEYIGWLVVVVVVVHFRKG